MMAKGASFHLAITSTFGIAAVIRLTLVGFTQIRDTFDNVLITETRASQLQNFFAERDLKPLVEPFHYVLRLR